jgi:hypothetical protein
MIRSFLSLTFLLWGGMVAACPGLQNKGKHLYVSARQLASPVAAAVRAGGTVILDGCETLPGTGQVPFDPSISVFYVTDRGEADLVFRTEGDCDTVLLVRTPSDRWAFDDDNGGAKNARLRVSNPRQGRYEVWVGTAGSFSCDTNLTLQTVR